MFPPVAANDDEFIGVIIAPNAVKWAGVVLGPGMNGNLLLVAWPNGNNLVGSARMTTCVFSCLGCGVLALMVCVTGTT